MNNEYLKQELLSISYKDETDAVTLRYLVLHLLAEYATTYKKLAGTAKGLELLQQFKKLEAAQIAFKEKCRGREMTECDFMITRELALRHVINLSTEQLLLHAA